MEHVTQNGLKPSESVREIETQDGAVLLDIRQGLCLSMTPLGIRIWKVLKLMNLSIPQMAEALATEFSDVPREQIGDDIAEFIKELELKHLLVAGEPSIRATLFERILVPSERPARMDRGATQSRKAAPRFFLWKTLIGLLLFDLFRFGNNFSKIHRIVQQWPIAARTAPANLVDQVCQAMNLASVWYPKRVLCLQRSAVLTCVLRNCGIAAHMVMGAQKFPFKAHAWTEVEGRAINERRDVQNLYLIWERC